MALRAGYYGVKKTVLRAIEGLSGAKIIKTIGNGLKLTSAGTMSVDIDSDKMEFKNGKLSVKDSGLNRVNVYTGNVSAAGNITVESIADASFIEFVLSDDVSFCSSYLIPAYTFKNLSADRVLGVWDYQAGNLNYSMRCKYVDDTTISITEITTITLKEINIL